MLQKIPWFLNIFSLLPHTELYSHEKVKVLLSCVQLFVTPWTVALQDPLSMEFSRQEYWNGLPFSSPVDHILSEIITMTHPSWVALHGMAHNFIELNKAVIHIIILVSFL